MHMHHWTQTLGEKWFICNTSPMKATTDERAQALAGAVWDRCLGSRVTRLHRLVALHYDQALAEVGLTLPQVEILCALQMRARAVGPSEMGQRLHVGRSAMSRKLAALEDKGWIATAERSPTGRSMSVVITTAGRQRLAEADAAWERAQTLMETQLGSGAAGTIDAWLAALDT